MSKKNLRPGLSKWHIYSETRVFGEYSDQVSAKKLGEFFFKSSLKISGRVRGRRLARPIAPKPFEISSNGFLC